MITRFLSLRPAAACCEMGLCVAVLLVGAAQAQVTSDLWDVRQGTAIRANSGHNGHPFENMFGALSSLAEDRDAAIFRDDQPAGALHFVEWRTAGLIRLQGFHLVARDDATNNPGDRGFKEFRLYARIAGATNFSLVHQFNVVNPYPANSLSYTSSVAPVVARDFRGEFVQYAGSSLPGPRIVELDGYGEDLGCQPLLPTPVGWWRAENNPLDSAGTNHATLSNGATYAKGLVGQAFRLDGRDDQAAAPFRLTKGNFTVEFWVRASKTDQATGCGVLSSAGSGQLLAGTFQIGVDSRDHYAVVLGANQALLELGSVSTVYEHLAVTFTGERVTVFRNGQAMDSTSWTSSLGFGSLILGADRSERIFFGGDIDEVSIYDRSLSQAEIAAIYDAGNAGKCAPLPVYNWVGGDGDWNNPAHWDLRRVPGPGEKAVIGGTPLITLPGAVRLAGLELGGATCKGGAIVIDSGGYMEWTSGQLQSLRLVISEGARLDLSGAASKNLESATLENAGICVLSEGSLVAGLDCYITNAGVFELQNAGALVNRTGQSFGRFFNLERSVLRRSGAEGTNLVSQVLENSGRLDIQSGAVNFPQATNVFQDTVLEGPGRLVLSGGQLVPLTSISAQPGARLVIQNGTLGGKFDFSGGGRLVWTGGRIEADLTIGIDSLLDLNGSASLLLDGGTLQNDGTAAWFGPGSLVFNRGASVVNEGLYTILNDASMMHGGLGALGRWINTTNGTLRKTSATGATRISNTSLINNGTVDLETGILQVVGNYAPGADSVHKFRIAGSSLGTQHGQLQVRGTATLAGTLEAQVYGDYDPQPPASFPVILCDARQGTFKNFIDPAGQFAPRYTDTEVLLEAQQDPEPIDAPPGLISWWPGDDHPLDVRGGNDGTITGAVAYAAGKVGQAFELTDADSAIQVGNPISLRLQDFSLSSWIKRADPTLASPDGEVGYIFGYGQGGYSFGMANDGRLVLGKTGSGNVFSSFAITDTFFHHVAVTKSDSVVTFFLDGETHPAPDFDLLFTFVTGAAIGAQGADLSGSFWGVIDELQIFNRPLALPELNAIYLAGKSGQIKPPVILAQPDTLILQEGQTANLSVVAAGSGPLHYQWLTNDVPIPGATDNILVIPSVTAGDTVWTYTVAISNRAGVVVSAPANIFFPGPPEITRQPASRFVFVGGVATFTVIASGPPPLSYQWFFNGSPLPGRVSPTLRIYSANFADEGRYHVEISNEYGTVSSDTATLEVVPACVRIKDGLAGWWEAENNALDSVAGNHGALMNGTGFARGARGNAFNLDGNDDHVLIPASPSLSITGALSLEAWIYPDSSASLDPLAVVSKFNSPERRASWGLALLRGRLQFFVGGTGTLTDNYNRTAETAIDDVPYDKWSHVVTTFDPTSQEMRIYLNGQALKPTVQGGRVARLFDSAEPVRIGALGGSKGAATNHFEGLLDEVTLYRKVLSPEEVFLLFKAGSAGKCKPPAILQQPQDQLAFPGEQVVFSVGATGVPPLRYQWMLNGVAIPNATNQSFEIQSVRLADYGGYSVSVRDYSGSVVSQTALLRTKLPLLPFTDDFRAGQPMELTPEGGFGAGYNFNATREPDEPYHGGLKGWNSLWLEVFSPVEGIATLSLAGSSFDTVLAVYRGDDLVALTTVAADDDSGGYKTSKAVFEIKPDLVYHVAVDGVQGAVGQIVLSWQIDTEFIRLPVFSHPPPRFIVGKQEDVNVGLSLMPDNTTKVTWFFNGLPTSQNLDLSLRGVDEEKVGTYFAKIFENGVYVTTKTFVVQFNQIDGRPAPALFAADRFVDSFDPERFGGGQKQLAQPRPRLLERASGPTRGYTGTQVFHTYGASAEEGEPIHCGIVGGASEWFSYQAPADGQLTVHTGGSDYDTILAVYYVPDNTPPNTFAELVNVACDNDSFTNGLSIVSFPAVADTVYYIAVDGVAGATGIAAINYELSTLPVILASPQSQVVREGTDPSLEVSAVGASLAYQWFFNDLSLGGATASTLVLSNVQPAQAGNYHVLVSNAGGSATSGVAVLAVLEPMRGGLNPQVSNGVLTLEWSNLSTQSYLTVQGTLDLTNWLDLITTNPAGGSFEFTVPASSNQLFLRAIQGH